MNDLKKIKIRLKNSNTMNVNKVLNPIVKSKSVKEKTILDNNLKNGLKDFETPPKKYKSKHSTCRPVKTKKITKLKNKSSIGKRLKSLLQGFKSEKNKIGCKQHFDLKKMEIYPKENEINYFKNHHLKILNLCESHNDSFQRIDQNIDKRIFNPNVISFAKSNVFDNFYKDSTFCSNSQMHPKDNVMFENKGRSFSDFFI